MWRIKSPSKNFALFCTLTNPAGGGACRQTASGSCLDKARPTLIASQRTLVVASEPLSISFTPDEDLSSEVIEQ